MKILIAGSSWRFPYNELCGWWYGWGIQKSYLWDNCTMCWCVKQTYFLILIKGTSTIWVSKRNVSLKHCHFVTIQLRLEITHSIFTWILWQIHERVVMLHPKYYWVGKIEQFWYSFSFFCCQIRNCLSSGFEAKGTIRNTNL